MKINILSISHKLPAWIEKGIDDFIKRFNQWKIEIIELKPSNKGTALERMAQEYENLQKYLNQKALIIILDEKGNTDTTNNLSINISKWQHQYSCLYFIIGGADGIDIRMKKQANYSMQLSAMTLPHGFARLILVEQLYRAWSIINNHPYHRI